MGEEETNQQASTEPDGQDAGTGNTAGTSTEPGAADTPDTSTDPGVAQPNVDPPIFKP